MLRCSSTSIANGDWSKPASNFTSRVKT